MAETGVIRSIGGIVAEVTVKEQARDDLTITNHPVERGASITDHAFKEPAQITIQAGWSAAYVAGDDSPGSLSDLYDDLLAMQSSATLIEVQTGKRLYQNMLIKSLDQTTDQTTENALVITAQLREIILVDTLETKMPANSVRSDPQSASTVANGGTKSVTHYTGPVP